MGFEWAGGAGGHVEWGGKTSRRRRQCTILVGSGSRSGGSCRGCCCILDLLEFCSGPLPFPSIIRLDFEFVFDFLIFVECAQVD